MCLIAVSRERGIWRRRCCIAEEDDRIWLLWSGLQKRAGGAFLGGWTRGLILIFGPVAGQQGGWWGTSLVAEATSDILVSDAAPNHHSNITLLLNYLFRLYDDMPASFR